MGELEHAFDNDEIRVYFEFMGIDTCDTWKVFEVLDEDDSGCVIQSEFIDGCWRLRDKASAFQLAALQKDVGMLCEVMGEFCGHAAVQLDKIESTIVTQHNSAPISKGAPSSKADRNSLWSAATSHSATSGFHRRIEQLRPSVRRLTVTNSNPIPM